MKPAVLEAFSPLPQFEIRQRVRLPASLIASAFRPTKLTPVVPQPRISSRSILTRPLFSIAMPPMARSWPSITPAARPAEEMSTSSASATASRLLAVGDEVASIPAPCSNIRQVRDPSLFGWSPTVTVPESRTRSIDLPDSERARSILFCTSAAEPPSIERDFCPNSGPEPEPGGREKRLRRGEAECQQRRCQGQRRPDHSSVSGKEFGPSDETSAVSPEVWNSLYFAGRRGFSISG